jgi:hypothetical protein
MKRPNLESLDESLRLMPKPNLSKVKETQIKRTILNTRTPKTSPKKKINYKAITASIGAVAAALLFAVLVYGNLGQEQPQPTQLTFSSFVDEDITKVSGEMNEDTYVSDDRSIINLFYETIGEMQFTETEATNIQYREVIEVYQENGNSLETFHFTDSNVVMIDGNKYEIEASKWHDFKEIFFTEEYLVVEDVEEEPEEEPEETENVQELLDAELAKAPPERNWEAVLQYIRKGANPDRALLLAAKENIEPIIPQLLKAGADPNAIDGDKNTPLTLTTSTEVASLLLNSGADLNHRNARDYNALVKAVYGHQTEMVKLLLEAGADPNTTVTPNSDVSVLWMAGKYNNQPIGDLLLQHGADQVEGYDLESWLVSQIPNLSEMLGVRNSLRWGASIGRLPGLEAVQMPADPSTFPGQFGEPFESFSVEGGTADVYGDHIFIKPDGQDLYTAYRYELNPGDWVTVAFIENDLGEPSSSFMIGDKRVISYNLGQYEIRFAYDGTVSSPKAYTAIEYLELLYKQPGVAEHAKDVFNLLAENNMSELASLVHPEKGLLFAPYLQLTWNPMTEETEPVTFEAEAIPELLHDQTVYHWGYGGGSGLPIEMTPQEYFNDYVYTQQEPDAVYVNQQNLTAPEFFTENIRGMFPDAHMVQYSFHETVPGEDLSWVHVTLIFEPYNNEWKLVGILHNAWTP